MTTICGYILLLSTTLVNSTKDGGVIYGSGSQTFSCQGPPNWHLIAHGLPFEKICQGPPIREDFYGSIAVILKHFNFKDPQFDMH